MVQIQTIYHKGKTFYLFQELDWGGKAENEWMFTSTEYINAQKRAKKFFGTVPIKDYRIER